MRRIATVHLEEIRCQLAQKATVRDPEVRSVSVSILAVFAVAPVWMTLAPSFAVIPNAAPSQGSSRAQPSKAGKPLKARIPGQKTEIQVSLPLFEPQDPADANDVLLLGATSGNAILRVHFDERVPFFHDADRLAISEKNSKARRFKVGDIPCTESPPDESGLSLTFFEAYPSTPEHVFEIRVMVVGGNREDFDAKAFSALVRSFNTTGTEERATMRLPPAIYDFRDQAAKEGKGQLDWVVEQCANHPDAIEPHFYLGALAAALRKENLVEKGYLRAADLLSQKREWGPKDCQALARCWMELARSHLRRDQHEEAIPEFEHAVALACAEDPTDPQRLIPEAHYGIACCHAKSGRSAKAIEALRQAIPLWLPLKKRATTDSDFKALRSMKEFEALVGK